VKGTGETIKTGNTSCRTRPGIKRGGQFIVSLFSLREYSGDFTEDFLG
jgi:hypothetical protein